MRENSDSLLGNHKSLGWQECIFNSQFFPLVIPKRQFPMSRILVLGGSGDGS